MRQKVLLAAWAVLATFAYADCRVPGAGPVRNPVLAFKQRGTRCEGFYEARVGTASNIELVSLARGSVPANLKTAPQLTITSRSTKLITVRAKPVRRAIYYLMETQLAAGQTFSWPTGEVLARSDLSGTHLGILGEIGGGTNAVFYIPVSINGATGPVNAVFRAGKPLSDIRWRTKAVSAGRCTTPEAWQTVTRTEDDRRVIRITLPEGASSCIEVIGKDGTQPVSASFRVEVAP